MPTIDVKLAKKRADRSARSTRPSKISKSNVTRAVIDRTGPIATGANLLEWVEVSDGKGLGLAQRKR